MNSSQREDLDKFVEQLDEQLNEVAGRTMAMLVVLLELKREVVRYKGKKQPEERKKS